MVRNSPRASAGLSRFAASAPPAVLPAPISVCASSMKSRIGVARLLDRFDHVLQALLEFALDARARLQQSEIEREDADVADDGGHVAFGNPEREPFDQRRLAHARLADEDRIVLAAPREDIDHLPDLDVASEDGVDLAVAGLLRDVDGEAAQRFGFAAQRDVWLRRVTFMRHASLR